MPTNCPVAPRININGTSPDDLKAANRAARVAVEAAIKAVEQTVPHGRDYQTAPVGGAYAQARTEYYDRMSRLRTVLDELYRIAEDLHRQQPGK